MSETTFMGVERERIDWKPVIDYSKCDFCMECVKFCPHRVFEVRENQEIKLVVKNPFNCVVFCRACSKTCGPDALSFPDKNKTSQMIRDIRKEAENHE
ncbi:MAG TPA: 4Fe-4S binding protein [Bacteroidales bacterium]|nr:4Fe-4S binding protein [Bacteroidales bacterium]HPS72907.1 4Fe-4S binding protein [Bacteroidales bacterium]